MKLSQHANNQNKVARLRLKMKHNNPGKLRLSVYRSNSDIYAQIIDDAKGLTLVSANSSKIKEGNKTEQAAKVGEALAKAALEKKIDVVYFDRNYYRFHGRVKALAEAARAAGLKF